MSSIGRKVSNSKARARERLRIVDRLLSAAPMEERRTALEIGCGAGHSSRHIARRYGLEVTGTDIEEEKIRMASNRSSRKAPVRFMVADATQLPFENGSFDFVLSQNVFHHISDWRIAATEVARVLAPQGLFLFSDMTGAGTMMRFLTGLEKDHGFHEVKELLELMEAAGFSVAATVRPHENRRKEFGFLFAREALPAV